MSGVRDIERYDCFLGGTDSAVLQERLGLSLAGVAVARGLMAESLVTYQLDCYGEICFQQCSIFKGLCSRRNPLSYGDNSYCAGMKWFHA